MWQNPSFTTKPSYSLYSFPSFKKMASTTIITPTSTNTTTKPLLPNKPKHTTTNVAHPTRRREFLSLAASAIFAAPLLLTTKSAAAASDEEYVKDTKEVIGKIRTTITMDKKDPTVADAVAQLRDSSNSWVAKYRKEKGLLGRTSFRDMYSALNAVSGHYISFGPTAPIPAKRRARILEEMDTAEKALLRGR